jgi:hypothetical protein
MGEGRGRRASVVRLVPHLPLQTEQGSVLAVLGARGAHDAQACLATKTVAELQAAAQREAQRKARDWRHEKVLGKVRLWPFAHYGY